MYSYQVPKEVGKVGTESETFIHPVKNRKDGIEAMFGRMKRGERAIDTSISASGAKREDSSGPSKSSPKEGLGKEGLGKDKASEGKEREKKESQRAANLNSNLSSASPSPDPPPGPGEGKKRKRPSPRAEDGDDSDVEVIDVDVRTLSLLFCASLPFPSLMYLFPGFVRPTRSSYTQIKVQAKPN